MSLSARETGRVWLVGAGPGDPELLTVKAMRLLESADVVLHDRLVSPQVLALIPTGVLRLDVGKLGYARAMSQERINALLIRFAEAGYRVIRLKGGDPFVFGRGAEEGLALRDAGIPFGVVPGISAGISAPGAAGIPVTHRGLARSVAFVTAATATTDAEETIDWGALAGIDTLVVFMAGATLRRTARSLLGAGKASGTPVALIVDATLPSQEVVEVDLAGLAADPPVVASGRPALLVVGEVVRLRRALDPLLSQAAALGADGPPTARASRGARSEFA